MLDTQKVIIMIITFNILIGISLELQQANAYQDQNELDYTNQTNRIQDINNLDQSSKNEAYTQETTIGNQEWSKSIWEIVIQGMNPLSVTPNQFTNQLEKQIAWLLVGFRSIISLILALELVFVIKNRKYT